MKNASGVEQSDEGRVSNSGAAPLAREQAACECPARQQLQRNRQGYLNILELRKLGVEWGQRDGFAGRYGALTREEIETIIADNDAALAAPCFCGQKLSEAIYSRDLAWADKRRAEIERDQIRADAAATYDTLRAKADLLLELGLKFRERTASAEAERDRLRAEALELLAPFTRTPEQVANIVRALERVYAFASKHASSRASGEQSPLEARPAQDCPKTE